MKKYIFTIFALMLLVLPTITFAAVEDDICVLLNRIKTILLVVGIGIAVIFIVVGGIMYMTAAGSDEKAGKAKQLIINTLIGVAIMLLALVLVSWVQSLLIGSGMGGIFKPSPCVHD
ncbi:MAG TPA: pilin [Candidatus Portnoybacteria bacterium]|nr:pilin [Candidatus Portnoybacteria bacterium]